MKREKRNPRPPAEGAPHPRRPHDSLAEREKPIFYAAVVTASILGPCKPDEAKPQPCHQAHINKPFESAEVQRWINLLYDWSTPRAAPRDDIGHKKVLEFLEKLSETSPAQVLCPPTPQGESASGTFYFLTAQGLNAARQTITQVPVEAPFSLQVFAIVVCHMYGKLLHPDLPESDDITAGDVDAMLDRLEEGAQSRVTVFERRIEAGAQLAQRGAELLREVDPRDPLSLVDRLRDEVAKHTRIPKIDFPGIVQRLPKAMAHDEVSRSFQRRADLLFTPMLAAARGELAAAQALRRAIEADRRNE